MFGVYILEVDAEIARKIGFAFAQFLGQPHIVIGRDMREASSSLARAFANGAMASGADVTDIGLVTTPMLRSSQERIWTAGSKRGA